MFITLFQLLFQFLINIVKKIISDSTFTFWFRIHIAVIEPNFLKLFSVFQSCLIEDTKVCQRVCNTDVKIQIMRQKKHLTKDVKFHDDITQRNLGLMARLKNTEKFENVWFFNCNVYAKPEGKSRIRYDLFDNIDEKLKKKLKEG
jgi:hypothetical protein